jgi:glutaconate CoA-transferase subunit A
MKLKEPSTIMSAEEAISRFVKDGDLLFVGGFGNLYPFALAHEVIRQKKKDLTLAKHSPELIGDELIGAGCIKKLIFSWIGNPGVGSSHCFRRAVEQGIPHKISIEEYTHASITAMLRAGAMGISFIATKTLLGSDLLKIQKSKDRVRILDCPFTGEKTVVLRALEPDVALIHAQRADEEGNIQGWGIVSDIRDGGFASKRVIASVEEIVSSEVTRRDPQRTLIPGFKIDAIVKQEWGAHPSACQGYYDRDNDFFLEYERLTRSLEGFERYLNKWVYSINDRQEYLRLLNREKIERLRPQPFASYPVEYGSYSGY